MERGPRDGGGSLAAAGGAAFQHAFQHAFQRRRGCTNASAWCVVAEAGGGKIGWVGLANRSSRWRAIPQNAPYWQVRFRLKCVAEGGQSPAAAHEDADGEDRAAQLRSQLRGGAHEAATPELLLGYRRSWQPLYGAATAAVNLAGAYTAVRLNGHDPSVNTSTTASKVLVPGRVLAESTTASSAPTSAAASSSADATTISLSLTLVKPRQRVRKFFLAFVAC